MSWQKDQLAKISCTKNHVSKNKFSKDGRQKIVTQSVFELQKCLVTQNESPENFQHILINKFYHTRSLLSSCYQIVKIWLRGCNFFSEENEGILEEWYKSTRNVYPTFNPFFLISLMQIFINYLTLMVYSQIIRVFLPRRGSNNSWIFLFSSCCWTSCFFTFDEMIGFVIIFYFLLHFLPFQKILRCFKKYISPLKNFEARDCMILSIAFLSISWYDPMDIENLLRDFNQTFCQVWIL